VIPKHWRLVVDVADLPVFGKIEVLGALIFDSKEIKDVHFQAKIIWVRGGTL